MQLPSETDFRVQEQDSFAELHFEVCLQTIRQLHQQSGIILRVDSLALWNLINVVDEVLIPKKEEILGADFCTCNIWGGVWSFAATPLIVDLSVGHSDITMFLL